MADVTINLIHKEGALYYKTAKMKDYELMGEDSTVGADSGQTIAWVCADSSIAKLLKIKVNQQKTTGKNWKDFWEEKPKATDSSGKVFEGKVYSASASPSNREYNGYDIKYQTPDGNEKIVDPDVTIPPL